MCSAVCSTATAELMHYRYNLQASGEAPVLSALTWLIRIPPLAASRRHAAAGAVDLPNALTKLE